MTEHRPRAVIEGELKLARQDKEIVEDDLAEAIDHIQELEDELDALPPALSPKDEELWYARRDPRQQDMFGRTTTQGSKR